MKTISFSQLRTASKLNNLYIGSSLLSIAILDVFINSFFNVNLTSGLPNKISLFLPLVLGFIGFGILRMEFTGSRFFDNLNKNINTNNFNALLTLFIIFVIP